MMEIKITTDVNIQLMGIGDPLVSNNALKISKSIKFIRNNK